DDITRLFGQEISDIVWGVTKISKISGFDAENAKAETLKKMILAMTNDVRVILIKLADRYHNIQTLGPLRPDKQKRIAKETLDIYAPIAHRLGMGKMKTDLENISFRYAYPDEFKVIHEIVEKKRKWADEKIHDIKEELLEMLKQFNIKGDIQFRIKREISIYRKLERQNLSLDRMADVVFDLVAMRIVTDTVENCYALMGEIHQKWQMIPKRWRDFIATPKSNGYRSIHTTVMGIGTKFEIQIRTSEMHKVAEEGIAAHWKYKEGLSFLENDQRLEWFREMIEAHKENPNPTDFLNLVKGDLIQNEVYVFTPKGKVLNLKKGATPIDFAYAIHSEVGDHCKGAIVNENFVPLRTQLHSGDVVEIMTGKSSHPSSDWLKYVVTNKARKRILNYILKQENTLNQEKGKRMWNRIMREYRKKHKLTLNEKEIEERIAGVYSADIESFFRDIGSSHKLLDKRALKRLFPEVNVEPPKPVKKLSKKGPQLYKLVNVEGLQDVEVVFARCCSPIKGDDIAGYVTRNRGIVLHKTVCSNLKHVVPSRRKSVFWNEAFGEHLYEVRFDVTVNNKPGLLSQVTGVFGDLHINIIAVINEKISQQIHKLKLSFEVKDTKQLNKIYHDINNLKDVISIRRKRA
ncbi:MAG: bifunctional (p)ppGpp synthetase/guanosine-3',5'-bis(diphosphate) 3'-pyrophosphohydrolase, partial [bacterium]|nr:bifunctional (p)ppGpp synthetase/guanosine-3',5'-bis(diphosphate) 3'-pyrophosphohydrolase [bacterium]